MRRRSLPAFLGVVALQLLLLVGMIVKRVHMLGTGERILLQCEPVDPRSFLSGDYVVLNFKISRFAHEEVQRLSQGLGRLRRHEEVYVAVEPPRPGAPAEAVALSRDRERLRAKHRVVLRGLVREDYEPSWRGPLALRYGVEHYFVPQREGERIEQQLRQASVEVAVAGSGESAIRRLFIGGREVTFH